MKVPNPSYLCENTFRLIVIGSSITFFLLMSFVDLIQTLLTFMLIICNRISYMIQTIMSSSPMSRGRQGPVFKTTKQITYESTIIISNIQMLVLMVTILTFAVALGIV